jgi:FtsH-binding integral membrane protein
MGTVKAAAIFLLQFHAVMARVLGWIAVSLVIAWVLAHLLFLGPLREAAEATLAWALWLAAFSGVVAALTVLAVGLATGRNRPVWLRFVRWARAGAAMVGCGLIVIGLLHYRDTEPHGEIRWVILGLAVLAGAGVVHSWVVRTQRAIY